MKKKTRKLKFLQLAFAMQRDLIVGGQAVMIDLKKYGELWEDFYDGLTAKKREKEPRESLASVKELLTK